MSNPGYQGSDKSGVEVSFYAHGDDPVFNFDNVKGALHLKGSGVSFDGPIVPYDGVVSSVSWTKTLGGTGNFSIEIKTRNPDLFLRGLNDDDWVDITFTQHDKKFHTVRGLIDTIREPKTVNQGATVKTIVISGRDFGKVWDTTPIFFNMWIGEGVGGGSVINRFASNDAIFGNVAKTVKAFLFAFLQELGENANARWAIPSGVPGITSSSSNIKFFRDCVKYISNKYTDQPNRTAFHPGFLDPEVWTDSHLWDLVKEWSDPSFCELYMDLVNSSGNQPGEGEELLPDQSSMAVIVRDKPFLSSVALDSKGVLVPMVSSPWFGLPLYTVRRQEIGNDNVGRGGEERFNAYFVKNAATNEFSGPNIDLTKPLWFPSDIARRGIRRMNVTSNYHETNSDNNSMIDMQRKLLRDWYGLNPYFNNGSLSLGHFRPDIRIGSRIRIPGNSPDECETYYLEGLTQQWSLGSGRTSLTVTRGWKGNDRSLIKAVRELEGRYVIPDTPVTLEVDSFDPSKVFV